MPKLPVSVSLRHSVTIRKDVGNPRSQRGGYVPTFEDKGPLPAFVEEISALEDINANQQKGDRKLKVTMRAREFNPGLTDEILWDGRTLNLVSWTANTDNTWITIEAIEKVK